MYSSSFLVRSILCLCLITAASLSLTSSKIFAQTCGGRGGAPPQSGGTEFLLIFMQNDVPSADATATRYQDIYLASNSDLADTVTLSSKGFVINGVPLHWSKQIPLAARGSVVYRLST